MVDGGGATAARRPQMMGDLITRMRRARGARGRACRCWFSGAGDGVDLPATFHEALLVRADEALLGVGEVEAGPSGPRGTWGAVVKEGGATAQAARGTRGRAVDRAEQPPPLRRGHAVPGRCMPRDERLARHLAASCPGKGQYACAGAPFVLQQRRRRARPDPAAAARGCTRPRPRQQRARRRRVARRRLRRGGGGLGTILPRARAREQPAAAAPVGSNGQASFELASGHLHWGFRLWPLARGEVAAAGSQPPEKPGGRTGALS